MTFRKFATTAALSTVTFLVLAAATTSAQKNQKDSHHSGTPSIDSETSRIGALTGHAAEGKKLYQSHCIGCHGADGKGQGRDALKIGPQPRDFTKAKFKCRSTASGTLPTDEDLFNTITRGMANTSMKAWTSLTPQQRADLVAFIKTFSQRWASSEDMGSPIVIPQETPATPESVERGKVLFQTTLQCVKCHGAKGLGDGPSAAILQDDDGRSIKPHDFAHGGSRFKCGTTDEDLYRIIMTGLDGTPMASWTEYLDANQTWDLIHYIRTLQQPHGALPAAKVVPASSVNSLGAG